MTSANYLVWALIVSFIVAITLTIMQDTGPWLFWIDGQPWFVLPSGQAY